MTKEQIAAVLERVRAEALSLPPEERSELAQDLWDSIAGEDAVARLTPEQIAEYERRFAEHEEDPSSSLDWPSVHAEALARLKRR